MTEPDWVGTIAEGLPHPSVRRVVPDTQDRYDQVVAHLSEQLGADSVTHHRTAGGVHLHVGISLRSIGAGPLLDAELHAGRQTPVAWPPESTLAEVPPSEGTLAVAAAYGFVVTGLRVRPTRTLSIAHTEGRTCPGDDSPIDVPTPGLVVDIAFHDCTADAFRTQLRHDRRIPGP